MCVKTRNVWQGNWKGWVRKCHFMHPFVANILSLMVELLYMIVSVDLCQVFAFFLLVDKNLSYKA